MEKTSLAKNKIRILLLEGIHESAIANFQHAGYTNIEFLPNALPEDDLIKKIPEYHMIGIRSTTQITEKVLLAAKKLVAIGAFCIGTNQIDLNAALMRGVPVFNAPYSNTRSVAELVLGEIIMLMRGIPEKNAKLHRGSWCKSAKSSFEIRGKKLGIIGYGNIGTQLGILAESMGMLVYFYDVVTKLPIGNAKRVSTLQEILQTCDIITLHVPETPATKNMIGSTELALLKPNCILINASRGSVVDLDALANALKNHKLLGAAIDVFPEEPHDNKDPFCSPLCDLDNVLLTPHIGGSTLEAQANIGLEVSEKLIRYSDNGSTLSAVNFPEVSLPEHAGRHRLLHIHKNVPGVLSKFNRIFSENNVNISAQYLQTKGPIGYVIVDVDTEHSEIALQKLRSIEETIRTRVLF